jgi:hypothetical protein
MNFRLISLLVCLWTCCASADEIELMLPQNNVSTRPVLEFRARGPSLGNDGRAISLTGHAYVLLGRELNENTLFNNVRGFYPDGKGAFELIHMAYGKGVVKQTLDDASSEVVFRVYLTPVQEAAVLKLFRSWDDKKYSLALNNCVDFTKAVAQVANLTLPHPRDIFDMSPEFPVSFVRGLSQLNDKYTPLKAGPELSTTPGTSVTPPSPVRSGPDPAEIARGQKQLIDRMNLPAVPTIVTPPPVLPPPPPPPAIVMPPALPPPPVVIPRRG